MARPSLLVVDEPTAGLSPQLAHELLHTQITRLAHSLGVAVLLVEQHAREALAVSDWAYLMVSGEVQVSEAAADLLARPDIGQLFLGGSARALQPPSEDGRTDTEVASDPGSGGQPARG
jgi:ABC-type branched-subunit amino acid transport system ATPase component